MRTGRNLTELFQELDRQARPDVRQDYVAPVTQLTMTAVEPEVVDAEIVEPTAPTIIRPTTGVTLQINGHGAFPLRKLAHEQIATYVDIPRDYYFRTLSRFPQLLATDVNAWLHEQKDRKGNPDARMIRVLDGEIRANLSRQYRPIENFDLAEMAITEARNFGGDLELVSADVTETKLYLKFVFHSKRAEIKVGDIVEAGVIVRNSEVGLGSIAIDPFIHRLICTNGMISPIRGLRKSHVGKAWVELDEAYVVYSDDTRKADDRALLMKARDVFRSSLNGDLFDQHVKLLTGATEQKIEGSVEGAVTVVAKRFGMNETERAAVLRNLIEGGDTSRYGLAQAVTAVANSHESYDRATELEAAGGQVIALPAKEWKEIADAKPIEAKAKLAA